MSTLERKQYQETKIMKTLSPVRNTHNSTQNVSQFDSNLDYLLEDLQNSVSRPGSSLGHTSSSTYNKETAIDARSSSLNRSSGKPSKPVTEYSSDDAYSYTSPDGRERVHAYKKEKYLYKTSGSSDAPLEKSRMQNSINQLDTLLDDLQQVKKSSYSEKEAYNSSGTSPGLHSSEKTVNRELHYGDAPRHSSRSRTLERTTERREGSLSRRDYQYSDEGTYGLRTTSPTPSSRTSTLTKQAKVKNIHEYPVEVHETVVPDIDPEVLAHLDPNLHPPGNTKVTTTIKTYTYEIPGSGDYPTNLSTNDSEKFVYSPNQSITTPSKSFVYNKVENKENTYYQPDPPRQQPRVDHYKESVADKRVEQYTETVEDNYPPPYQKPTPPGWSLVKETITTRDYQPGYNPEENPPSSHQTYVYNENKTTKNIHQNGYPAAPPPPRQDTYVIKDTVVNKNENYPPHPPPPNKEMYILKETHNTTINRNEPQVPFSQRGYPVYNPPDARDTSPQTTYIIKETHNTTNRSGGPPHQNGYPPNEPGKTVIYKHETHTTNTYGPGGPNRPTSPSDVEPFDINKYGKPKEPINIHYTYKSTNTTQNRFKGDYPPSDESQPLLPQKFPVDDGPDGPPKRLDDLMATIGNEPPNSPLNAGFTAHEQELAQQKKIDTLKKQSAQADDSKKKEPVSKTKNVSGPPVYYPPGHEMFAKNEESEAAWRAQGGYAKASGKYEYEAESRSKSKSKSGAAVVPICLPLCCGLPCTLL